MGSLNYLNSLRNECFIRLIFQKTIFTPANLAFDSEKKYTKLLNERTHVSFLYQFKCENKSITSHIGATQYSSDYNLLPQITNTSPLNALPNLQYLLFLPIDLPTILELPRIHRWCLPNFQ